MESVFLKQALIFLTAAVVCVPIAKKMGMGSVLGYLLAGVLIGPFVLGFVGSEGEDIMHAAEFGVVMMLFLIGLELDPKSFWEMRKSILGLGMMQMGFTILIIGALGYWVMGWSHQTSLAVSLGVAMSSTAIVLQTLKEKGIGDTSGGKASFSVLLFQDIMVIPILAVLPLLSMMENDTSGHGQNILSGMPGWLQTLIIIISIGMIFLSGRYIFIPLLRIIAKTRLREMFTATSLLLVIAVSYLMQVVGMSPALGAFLAGVVLANSEYRHELESDLEPFKGLLLGLFFVGVGVTMNIRLIAEQPLLIFGIVGGLMIVKALVLYLTGRSFKVKSDQNLLFAIILSQVGEFSFVIFSFSGQLEILDRYWTDIMMSVTALSMCITPILLVLYERVLVPHTGIKEKLDEQEADEIHKKHPVIIAGFGHFGSTVGRFLRANKIDSTILDHDSDRVDMLRKMGFDVYYGDATRVDLLKSAGIENAKILIAAIDDPQTNFKLVKTVKKHFPHIQIMARAKNRLDAYDFIEHHVKHIYRETLYTSVYLAVDVLTHLGFRKYTATRKGMDFIKYDEEAIKKLAKHRHSMKDYIITVRKQIELQEKLISEDLHSNLSVEDHSWDSEIMREK
jgi:CPA2 family monovalent cation:H+ antiporter-2